MNIDKEDISTIISVFPVDILEVKPGLHPGYFKIPACKDYKEPSLIDIGQSCHYLYLGQDQKYEIANASFIVAKSIVNDCITAMIEYNPEERAWAGLLAFRGKVTRRDLSIKEEYKEAINDLVDCQTRWFKRLVTLADNDWSRTHAHTSISDIQREAAKRLNLNRDWLTVVKAEIPIRCFACQSLIPPASLVCQICKTVLNPDGLKKAQKELGVLV